MKKILICVAIALVSAALLFYSCGKTPSAQTVTPPPSKFVNTAAVSIAGFAFVPDTVYLKPGGTITWTNMDTAPHTATDGGAAFNSGRLSTNQTYAFTFPATPGTFAYKCTIHSMMKTGYVIVGN